MGDRRYVPPEIEVLGVEDGLVRYALVCQACGGCEATLKGDGSVMSMLHCAACGEWLGRIAALNVHAALQALGEGYEIDGRDYAPGGRFDVVPQTVAGREFSILATVTMSEGPLHISLSHEDGDKLMCKFHCKECGGWIISQEDGKEDPATWCKSCGINFGPMSEIEARVKALARAAGYTVPDEEALITGPADQD